jgi:GT2 family glycosyltransferase/glycosyltransferase involved in cell wall biosynthesis
MSKPYNFIPVSVKLQPRIGFDPSLLFDSAWYLKTYPDVAAAGVNPLMHYLASGGVTGRNPSPLFDSAWYLKTYPDVAAAGVNPLMHYVTEGSAIGKNPFALFDSAWYLKAYPDVAAAGVNPLIHYVTEGGISGCDPSPLFDSDWYLKTYPDVAAAGVNPLVHFVTSSDNRDPSPLFDSVWYLKTYPDVAAAGVNPLLHFVTSGCVEGRLPGPLSESRNLPIAPMAFPYQIGPKPLIPKTSRRVTILIPVHGQWHWTERCLKALALTEAVDLASVVVIDDASTDDTLANMGRFPWAEVRQAPKNLGFTRACNFGALGVETEFILFLNNDTEPLPGFLESLIACADSESDVGIVGSKLIYPDGILQEAGSIIWRDGSRHNYGKYQDADEYKYLMPRNVDYCSGASILVRTELFQELNGFDERFAPAYFEDVDLCFAARKLGFHTRYEPRSVVIHHEGGSHGRDVTKGLKAYQVTNKEKFCEKWKKELKDHSAPYKIPLRSASRSGHKVQRILLFADHLFLTPQNDAGSLRRLEILLICQEMGYEVVFCSAADSPLKHSAADLRRIGILTLAGEEELREFLSEESDFVDLVFLSRARTAFSWLELINQLHPEIPVAFDTVDLHHVRELELAQIEISDVDQLRARATKRIELFLLEKTDVTIVVSDQEKKYLESFSPDSRIEVIGTIHRIEEKVVAFNERKGLLFVGSFLHQPNEDGLRWFFEEVWDHLDSAIRQDGLSIIGKNPPKKLVEEAPDGAKFLGWVESTDSYVDAARISLAPLRFGAGIKGKIGEAWSRGLPVIGTASAFRGMVDPGAADFHSADDPEKFAELINSVYSSESLWAKASEAGQRRVQETLSRDVAKAALINLIDSVAR